MDKSNLLSQCLGETKDRMRAARLGSPENLTAQVIEEFYCTRCRNDGCSNAGYGDSPWLKRISTQVDRFFHSPQANPEDAKYRDLVDKEFLDMTQHAMRLVISNQRSDWEVPEMAAILDSRGLPQPPRFDLDPGIEVEAQIQQMLKDTEPPVDDDQGLYPDEAPVVEPEPQPTGVPDFARDLATGAAREAVPANRPPRKAQAANVPKRGGLMLDGGPVPPTPTTPDPWAVPEHHNPAATKVPVGGTFRFGSTPPTEKKK